MNSIHPINKPNPDEDLGRILRLYEIIKRYEFLVEYLLAGEHITSSVDEFDIADYLHGIECNIIRSIYKRNDNVNETARVVGRSRKHVAQIISELNLYDKKGKIKEGQQKKEES
jgi:adenine C2-methylase RlmN of 23S rRNA A2503 and tRNA A37